jgi:hypothetical protein
MTYEKYFICVPKYKRTSNNQYGDRYKTTENKQISVVSLSCKHDDTDGLHRLILLSHELNVPVRYDFGNHTAYIKLVSAEKLQEIM